MGITPAALVPGRVIGAYRAPDWVIICCAPAMAGTVSGGWRLLKTMGQRPTKLNPFGGFAAPDGRALGGDAPDPVGLDFNDSGRPMDGRGVRFFVPTLDAMR
jgi:hypothetical protein